jgi:hypothetical protein
MKKRLLAAALAGLGVAFSAAASAQMTQPWQRGFWGYAGLAIGNVTYKIDCAAGFSCDRDGNAIRVYGGGRFNQYFGLEGSYTDMGDAQIGGGQVDARAVNLSLLAGMPLGAASAGFLKLGGTYARTEVSGATAPGFVNGTENGFGPSFGIGVRLGLTDRVSLRMDVDRQRIKFKGMDRENVDTLMLGLQFGF